MNGFATLLAFLACVPALVYRKIDVSFVTKNYYHLMTSTLLCSVLSAAGAYVKSRWAKKSALNPKGSTGNFIVDSYYGREFNPSGRFRREAGGVPRLHDRPELHENQF